MEVNDNMKKLIKLMIVAVVATTVLVFTGCPTQNSDLDYPSYTSPFDAGDLSIGMADTDAVTMTATPDATNAYSTYNITIVGLVANIGDQYVVAGESIGSEPSNIGGNWNTLADAITDDGLIFTVDDTGTLDITFYGTCPSWGSNNSSEFAICEYDADFVKLTPIGSGNAFITGSAASDGSAYYVIDLTIDPNEL